MKVNIKWWIKLLLFFIPPNISCDIAEDEPEFVISKKLFGNIYIVESRYCPSPTGES